MKRLFAALLSAVLLFGFAPAAHADVAGLTLCADSPRFQERAAAAATEQAKARFSMYSQASCGEDGLPHLVVDGRFSHAGDFLIPSLLFLYMAGWIGWAGRSYMMAIRGKGSQMKEIQIDTGLALTCALGAAKWPVDAAAQMMSGEMFADDSQISVSPR
ncbi:MAG: Photosystem I reaction center subunit III [Synechococcus sp. SB0678_bin_12]|nr:Photosystem I reaction center subunit III [Synechococcus sp. SB0678_bin_12]MYI88143.1 Photosystem I reaction center subunit III [Synechococcus sp. SB0672_bin_10]